MLPVFARVEPGAPAMQHRENTFARVTSDERRGTNEAVSDVCSPENRSGSTCRAWTKSEVRTKPFRNLLRQKIGSKSIAKRPNIRRKSSERQPKKQRVAWARPSAKIMGISRFGSTELWPFWAQWPGHGRVPKSLEISRFGRTALWSFLPAWPGGRLQE